MDNNLLVAVVLDGVLLLSGIFMSAKKFKEKHSSIVWKLFEYLTMAIGGYVIGGGAS